MFARALILLVRAYQLLISPLFGQVCRFEPSCSRYAIACLERHGALRGSWLALRRLLRCHPFHPGGYDPPPPPRGGTEDRAPSDGSPPPVPLRLAVTTPSSESRRAALP